MTGGSSCFFIIFWGSYSLFFFGSFFYSGFFFSVFGSFNSILFDISSYFTASYDYLVSLINFFISSKVFFCCLFIFLDFSIIFFLISFSTISFFYFRSFPSRFDFFFWEIIIKSFVFPSTIKKNIFRYEWLSWISYLTW